MFPIPPHLQRLADQIDGWLDLRCPDKALELLDPLLGSEGRSAGLEFRVRALCRLGRYADALIDLGELRKSHATDDWVLLTDGWCRKRLGDLHGAVQTLRALAEHDPRHDTARFNLACYLALLGDKEGAIEQVTIACELSAACRDLARDEPDFDSLRADPRFRALLRSQGLTPTVDDDVDDEDDADDDEDDGPMPDLRRN